MAFDWLLHEIVDIGNAKSVLVSSYLIQNSQQIIHNSDKVWVKIPRLVSNFFGRDCSDKSSLEAVSEESGFKQALILSVSVTISNKMEALEILFLFLDWFSVLRRSGADLDSWIQCSTFKLRHVYFSTL